MKAIEVLQALIDLHNRYYKGDLALSIQEVKTERGTALHPRGGNENYYSHDLFWAVTKVTGMRRVNFNNIDREQLKQILTLYEQLLKQRAGMEKDWLCPLRVEADARLLPQPAAKVESIPAPAPRPAEKAAAAAKPAKKRARQETGPDGDLALSQAQSDSSDPPARLPKAARLGPPSSRPIQQILNEPDNFRSPDALKPLPPG